VAALRLDPRTEPVSARVREALRWAIDDGTLLAGDRVPTVRALAAEHGLAPNTVAKAYRELEGLGYLDARGRTGTFVATSPPRPEDEAGSALIVAAERFAMQARRLGASSGAATDAVRSAMEAGEP
jgi:DNA-binding transcriptional regulator YhcF (GntR family)